MIETWGMPVWQVTGKQPRTVYVYVPDEAAEDPDARFPVLYMFDGHNVFFDEDATYGKSWGMGRYMEESGTPMMIVAVDCNHRPRNGRLSEYSPYTFTDSSFGRVVGRGKRFMERMCGTLKPEIDSRYPTLPERKYTWIAGSSMGGLMSLYAVTACNSVFSRAAALSPSVWVAPERLCGLIRNCEMDPDTSVYLDYGQQELGNHRDMLNLFLRVSAELARRQIPVCSRIVPGGTHCEACWEQQIPYFMELLSYEAEQES